MKIENSLLTSRRLNILTFLSAISNVLLFIWLYKILSTRPFCSNLSTENENTKNFQQPQGLGRLYSSAAPSSELSIPNDLSLNFSFSLSDHSFIWSACPITISESETHNYLKREFCPETATTEQKYQLQWFGEHVIKKKKFTYPNYLNCIHLPPQNYEFPSKFNNLPALVNDKYIHWSNLRVNNLNDLIEFNKNTPKNLYHFDAPKYDLDALSEIQFASKFIPFGNKIRLGLDLGAGGGSLGLLLQRKYDIQILSTVFADWPYCEYISERGGLCILIDSMESLPFSKFTFDLLHLSWLLHGQSPNELIKMFFEFNRIIRPGGYLWMRGGWNEKQIKIIKWILEQKLGYTTLVDEKTKKSEEITKKISFGPDLSYEFDWSVIWVKPIRSKQKPDCSNEPPMPIPIGTAQLDPIG